MKDHQKTSFKIRIDGDLDGVDLQTFVDILANLSVAIHELNDELKTNRSLKINIKEISTGSYDIFLMIKEMFLDTLTMHMLKDALWYGGIIVSLLANLLLIRKHLEGKEAQKIEKKKKETIITNKNGDIINIDNRTYNIYEKNQIIDSALGKSFGAIEENRLINRFEIYDDKEKLLFKAQKNDFKGMSLPSYLPKEDTRVVVEELVLHVFKVVFEKGYKWRFIYKGERLSAEIEDDSFYDKIDKGIKFSKGDILIADVETTYIFDKTVQTHIIKDRKIKTILQHIPRSEQQKLFK